MEKKLKKLLDQGKFKDVSEERSRTMSAIRAKHNRSTEYRLRMALVREGLKGWGLHAKKLSGNPDFYFPKKKLAVFVDGCFWHGCPVHYRCPRTNASWWNEKLKDNMARDRRKTMSLRRFGWKVVRVWEHQVRRNTEACLRRVIRALSR